MRFRPFIHRPLSRRPLCIACVVTLGTLVAMVLGFALASTRASAQEPPQPTKEHAILKMDAGTWEADGKFFVPGMDAITSKGEETNRMMGDLWLISDYKDAGGFEGHGILGYDPEKKKYVGSWADSMASYVHTMEGTYDAKTKTLTMMVDAKDPAGKSIKQRHVTVFKSADAKDFAVYMPGPDGKEMKLMEIALKRKK